MLLNLVWGEVAERGSMNTAEIMKWLIDLKGLNGKSRLATGACSMNRLAQIIKCSGLFVCVGKEREHAPQWGARCESMREYNVYEVRPLNDIVAPYLIDSHPIRKLKKQPMFVRTEVARRLKQ
tara:strand:- start:944 stop:1312 length:369 start_codon:yes stop_codon:yes gene_type:complete